MLIKNSVLKFTDHKIARGLVSQSFFSDVRWGRRGQEEVVEYTTA